MNKRLKKIEDDFETQLETTFGQGPCIIDNNDVLWLIECTKKYNEIAEEACRANCDMSLVGLSKVKVCEKYNDNCQYCWKDHLDDK